MRCQPVLAKQTKGTRELATDTRPIPMAIGVRLCPAFAAMAGIQKLPGATANAILNNFKYTNNSLTE